MKRFLMLAMGMFFLTGCATTSGMAGKKDIKKAAVIAVVTNDLYGSRAGEGMFMKRFSPVAMEWSNRDIVNDKVRSTLEAKGIQVVEAPQVTLEDANKGNANISDPKKLADDFRVHNSDLVTNVDAYVVVQQLNIDMYGKLSSPVAAFFTGGVIGLVGNVSAKYYPAFLLASRKGLEATLSGPSECMIGLNMSVVDAVSFKVIARKSGILGRQKFPKDMWAQSYDGFSAEEKQTIKDSCQTALKNSLKIGLKAVGF